ncbi:MAG: NfeD family protein, partial [Treponema sp.]|nr:NfeD family protein [Treponema sp.]
MLNFIFSHLPWFWLFVMILAIVFEAITFSLTTVWAAISALLMVFLCRTGLPFRWQLLIFFIITILLMIFTRPFAIKKLKLGRVTTNVNSMDGQEVLVVKKITRFEKGEVRASNGVTWMAACSESAG